MSKNTDVINNVAAALFDLDGTLFDSVGMWHEIDEIFLSKRGFVPTEEYKAKVAALGFTATAYFTIDYYGLSDTPEQLMAEWTELAEHAYATKIKLFDGAKEYLEECAAAGVRVCAVTSLCREFAESCLKNNKVFELFEHIFTADETGLSKTSHEIYEHAAKSLGVAINECVAYDDVPAAIISAKRAGMTTIAVNGRMLHSASDCDGCCDYFVESVASAPKLVKNADLLF